MPLITFSGADPGGLLRGLQFNTLLTLYVFGQTTLGKQYRPRSDAAECGVWSGSTLFATHPAISHIFTGSKMDLLKRSTRKSVQNLSNLYKISHKSETLSQRASGGGDQLNPAPRIPSESAPAFNVSTLRHSFFSEKNYTCFRITTGAF